MMVLVLLLPVGGAGGSSLEALYPPDMTVIKFQSMPVTIRVPEGFADKLYVSVNMKDLKELDVKNEFVCFTVRLRDGPNEFEVTAYRKGDHVGKIFRKAFRLAERISMFRKAPRGYAEIDFHMTDTSLCAGCHAMQPSAYDLLPVKDEMNKIDWLGIGGSYYGRESSCYSCHKDIAEYPFVHEPVLAWNCLECHNRNALPIYSVLEPSMESCLQCHTKEKDDWLTRKYYHGPFNTGSCTICHNPHASENPFVLHQTVWDLCVGCHEGKGSGLHILKDFGAIDRQGRGHPTRGKKDPLREDRELSCSSCHEPHASDSPKLWRLKVGSGLELCAECHMRLLK